MEITISGLDKLAELMHPPLECPFCSEWKVCRNCNAIESMLLSWHGHMIDDHPDEVEAAVMAAVTAKGDRDTYRYYTARLKEIAAEPDGESDPAPDEQETTETADASGD